MAKAVSLEPNSWEERYWLAVAQAGAGIDPRPAIRRALVLNRFEPGLKDTVQLLNSSSPRQWELDRAAPAQPGAELRAILDHQSLSGCRKTSRPFV